MPIHAEQFAREVPRAVREALDYVDRHRAAQVEEWVKTTEIPVPSTQELRRALYIEAEMRKAGLDEVYRDELGNVVGILKGVGGGPKAPHAKSRSAVSIGVRPFL